MDLFIIRHAWAAERDDSAFPDDSLRPLTEKGSNRFARMIEALVPRGLTPQLIVTSPMLRCLQTAEILAKALGEKAKVVKREELLPGGDPKHLLAWTEEHASGLDQVGLGWPRPGRRLPGRRADRTGQGLAGSEEGGDRRPRVSGLARTSAAGSSCGW